MYKHEELYPAELAYHCQPIGLMKRTGTTVPFLYCENMLLLDYNCRLG